MKQIFNIIIILFCCLSFSISAASKSPINAKPNIIIFFIDDMGYSDLGVFGAKNSRTPNIDKLGHEGLKFTNFYSGWTACSPSRASLLTGSHAIRVGMHGSVCFPNKAKALNPAEFTMAEMFKSAGYTTGLFGKWHLGHLPGYLPPAHGFDEYWGIPYSNDMWNKRKSFYPPLPFIHNNKTVAIVDTAEDQSLLTKVFTEKALEFIKANHKNPFFAFIPHSAVHKPHYPLKSYLDKAKSSPLLKNYEHVKGKPNLNEVIRYAALMEELDDSVGEILSLLKELKIDNNTVVMFLSDNGGLGMSEIHPLKGGKGGPPYEGHMRTPLVVRWPAAIPAGKVCNEIGITVDFLPTMAKWCGGKLSSNKIDGLDITEMFVNPEKAKSPHTFVPYKELGWRKGSWKLLNFKKGNKKKGEAQQELYDLNTDIGEQNNIKAANIAKFQELEEEQKKWLKEIIEAARPHAEMPNLRPLVSNEEEKNYPSLSKWMKEK